MDKIKLTCIHHPNLFWYTKPEAVDSKGGYNAARRISFNLMGECGEEKECSCSGIWLRAVPGQQWEGKAEDTL